ncbi:relaxase/mobilization nuclease domain-containing protein [Ramlibacter sp.]|uniref:relaxase/mobilization nuclease domain-containing protein n=1 Tax=Ramlibacter sp. TaxID=1917967 RepID=UPI002619A036|nr:relaxase/mobilization nuclease domain-containing protein [Ramlibacter sp.]MDB5956068.1 Conjugal transfer protein TraS [Ramlibacter sp.]
MTTNRIDGVLVQWGDRLFYGSNRPVRSRTPVLTGAGLHARADVLRHRIQAIVVRHAPQVMVKVTGGGRGMAAIAAHLRYISKSGRLPFEDDRAVVRDGRDALRDVIDQWRCGGSRIPEHSERREAFNIMLSMPAGTQPDIVRNAAREFAKAELSNYRYVMVLHTHQANPHVHLAVRAEGRDGRRLNPRKQDLRRWREVFAEKLRGWGIEAEASSKLTRGSRHHNERLWERKAREQGRVGEHRRSAEAKLTPARRDAAQAWCEIAKALASSDDLADRELGRSVVNYARWLPGVRYNPPEKQPQRELPGLERTISQRSRPEPGWER